MAFVACAGFACNAILSLDNYRACEGAECGDASADAFAADGGGSCTTSADCSSGNPICSLGACTAAVALSRGTAGFQCVVLGDGTARCWGYDSNGQLGDNTTNAGFVAKPATVQKSSNVPLGNIASIVTGLSYGCALTHDGDVYCWGTEYEPNIAPSVVLNKAKQISGSAGVSEGTGSTCAVTTDDTVVCWGTNGGGRLGCTPSTGTTDDAGNCAPAPATYTPDQANLLGSANGVTAGTNVVCTYSTTTATYNCFGNNVYGGFGEGSTSTACCDHGSGILPGEVTIGTMDSADSYAIASTNNGYWYGWGVSAGGAILGVAPNSFVDKPTLLGGQTQQGIFSTVTAGWAHACAILSDKTVKCWGQNDHGQVGNGSTGVPVTTAVVATGLTGIRDIAAHRNFTCAIDSNGNVWCWGQNEVNGGASWLLGNASTSGDVTTPALVGFD